MDRDCAWRGGRLGGFATAVRHKTTFGIVKLSIYYAENGVPINEVTAEDWHDFEKALSEHPLSKETFLVNGERAPRFGEAWKNPDLARSLRRIAGNGADGFYKGATAQAIVDTLHEFGGVMTLDDLAAFKPEWVEPISTTYRGWTVYGAA
ncbi:MAG: hypothetical protein NVS9B5_37690 [Terriglobales bacterium]